MKIIFAAAAAEVFAKLPKTAQLSAARSINLLEHHPRMYPIRRRGLMRGYRYFGADRYLFYYSLGAEEVRVTAIIPGVMRQA